MACGPSQGDGHRVVSDSSWWKVTSLAAGGLGRCFG